MHLEIILTIIVLYSNNSSGTPIADLEILVRYNVGLVFGELNQEVIVFGLTSK